VKLRTFAISLLFDIFDALVTFGFGKERLIGFYVGRVTALSLRYGISRGQIHEGIDRSCVLLWEHRP